MAKDLIICKNVHDTLLNEKKKKAGSQTVGSF